MPLQTIHRPPKLEEFYGNETLKESLRSVLERKQDKPHTFFFKGPSGCGKTTLARIVKTVLGCDDFDFHCFNASNTRGIDTVRQVISELKLYPSSGKIKIYFFDECHQLTGPAQEAFLKDTEHPPDHVFFIFCTTEPEKMKDTFKRRAFVGEVKHLTRIELVDFMKSILSKENITDFPESVISKIAKVSNGSPGIALSLLDSVIDLTDDDVALKAIEEQTVSEGGVKDICYALMDSRMGSKQKWAKVREVLKNLSGEPETARRAILGYFNSVALGENADPLLIASLMFPFMEPVFNTGKPGLTWACIHACFDGEK